MTDQAPAPSTAAGERDALTPVADLAARDTVWHIGRRRAAPIIWVATWGARQAFVIAVMPATDDYHSAERLVVGAAFRISADEEPERWRAWKWPVPGGVMHTTQHCDAVDAAATEQLQRKLQQQADKDPWWAA